MTDEAIAQPGAQPAAQPTAKPMTNVGRLRAILGGSAGNFVEWYDWFAYSSFALYFAPVFFPKGDQTSQLLQSAAVFAVGFFARPVGAWLMGHYADHAGRRAALTLSVAMMCAGALVIALAPGHEQIGSLAPIVLLGARLLQGLSVGGEYGASATYMSEMAGRARRGFWSSFQYVTLIAGQLVALGVLIVLQQTLSPEQLGDWGWRIPFFVGAALAVVVFWIRSRIEETPAFASVVKKERFDTTHAGFVFGLLIIGIAVFAADLLGVGADMPTIYGMRPVWLLFLLFIAAAAVVVIAPVFRRHPRETSAVLGLTAAGSLSFYAYTTYMQKFLVNTSGFSKDEATQITAAALFAFMVAQPVFGWLSDRLGRKPMLIASFGAGAVLAYPAFTAIAAARDPVTAFWLVLAPLLVLSAYTSISAVIKAELFPAHIRALGVALPYALANAAFGGTAEYAALAFKDNGIEQGFFIYVGVMCAIAFVVSILMRDTQRTSAIVED
jgi:MHS family alpha-ketoglutarate permease-like MFS transporter